ncbi:hypothetical protein [Pseudomonas sp. SWI44]|uniref:hypothetical protein n=1 Tax=Pseudomonas sp. SWI44 TaxID=2083053 RepID=UPI000CE5F9C1|nr:hypothetical protein [Pseudomonas sp. SWI44]AVD86246.1 hypothetical protein C4Q26_03400 [Pseudomonas sp. SWI44]
MTRLALFLLLLATLAGCKFEVCIDASGKSCSQARASTCELRADTRRQLSPHETQPEPTPALAPGRWIDERYEL